MKRLALVWSALLLLMMTAIFLLIPSSSLAEPPQLTCMVPFTPAPPIVTNFDHGDAVNGALWNAAGTRFLSWGDDGLVRLWDVATAQTLQTYRHTTAIHGARWNHDETRLLTWSRGGSQFEATMWDTISGDLQFTVQQADNSQWPASGEALWNHDETLFVTWAREAEAVVWDANTGAEVYRFQHDNLIWGVQWHGDNLLSWSSDFTARVWDMDHPDPLLILRHEDVVWGAAWHDDLILTWSLDQTAQLWDANSGHPLWLMQHDNRILTAAWHDNLIVTASTESTVKHWSLPNPLPRNQIGLTAAPTVSIPRDGAHLYRLRLSPNAFQAAASGQNYLFVWELASGDMFFQLQQPINDFVWSLDGRYLAIWNDSGQVEVRGGMSGELVTSYSHGAAVHGAAWSPAALLTWSASGTIRMTINNFPPPFPRPAFSQNFSPVASRTPTPESIGVTDEYRFAELGSQRQSFLPDTTLITSVDVQLATTNQPAAEGDLLQLFILRLDGSQVTWAAQFVPEGFLGWLRFELEAPVTLNESYWIKLESRADAKRFGWVWTEDSFPLGAAESNRYLDFAFRINDTTPIIPIQPPPPPTTPTDSDLLMTKIVGPTSTIRYSNLEGQPGETLDLNLAKAECCYVFVPVELQASWAASPERIATIDSLTGVLTISPDAESGSQITISATIGDYVIQDTLTVYDLAVNPFVGLWQEEAQLTCDTHQWIEPDQKIVELLLLADQTVSVTWVPLEIFVDYIGAYHFSPTTNEITFDLTVLNFQSMQIDPQGTYEFDADGRLILRDLWLGRPPSPVYCGHRFVRG